MDEGVPNQRSDVATAELMNLLQGTCTFLVLSEPIAVQRCILANSQGIYFHFSYIASKIDDIKKLLPLAKVKKIIKSDPDIHVSVSIFLTKMRNGVHS